MMVPKIITLAALVVAQNEKHCVRISGRGAHSKSKQHFPPASLSVSSTNVPATHLERWSRTVQSDCSQKLCRTLSEKSSWTAVWQLECSHPHKKKVGIGRRSKEIRSRYC